MKTFIKMYLWNALIPDLFHGPQLDFMRAIGLMILAKLLFGFGHGFGRFRHMHHRHHHHRMHKHFWNAMNSEERERLRNELRGEKK